MGFFGRSKSKKRAEAVVSAERWSGDENEVSAGRATSREVHCGRPRPRARVSKAGSRSGELSENGSNKKLSLEVALQEESVDTLSEFSTYQDCGPARKSLPRAARARRRRTPPNRRSRRAKQALVDSAIDEVIADSLEHEISNMGTEEVGVYRTMYHDSCGAFDEGGRRIGLRAALRRLETDPEQTLDAIRNALSVADALILQSHGSAASRQATDLLDPIPAPAPARPFFQNGQNMTG